MKKYFALLFVFNFELLFCQSFIHPSLPSDEITGLHFINNMEIIFINAGGSIYKSYDGGITWQLKKYYPNSYLAEIQFLDEKTGFVRTQNHYPVPNELIYTGDGGETWNESDVSIYSVNSFLPVTQSVILKTLSGTIQMLDNFYNSWQVTFAVPTFVDSGGDYISTEYYGNMSKLLKLDNGNILALGTNENAFRKGILHDSVSYILISEDQGISWDTLWGGLKQEIIDFTFVNDSTGWMISYDSLFKSTDGGSSWIYQDIINQYGYKYLFANGNNVYLLDYYNRIIKSNNNGGNWETVNLDQFNFTSVNFNNSNNGFLLGEALERTTDGGQSWTNLTPLVRNSITDLKFISPAEGISLGYYGIYKTYDGGHTWIPKFYKEGASGSFNMMTDSAGWWLSYDTIFKTTDKGETWNEFLFYKPNLLYNEIDFYDDHLGILTASEESNPGSHIYDIYSNYITTDGGVTWQKRPIDTLFFNRIKFSNSTHLWGIDHHGLWLSVDTAKTWKVVYPLSYYTAYSAFDFSDSGFGVISLEDLIITTDGGASWKVVTRENGIRGNDCKSIGRNYSGEYRILECSKGKLIITYLSPEGVIDYSYQAPVYTGETLNRINVFVEGDFPDVWIAGDGFTLLYRQFEKLYVGVDESSGEKELTYNLGQNYPNPFNPVTTIEFQIAKPGFISLKVYDILGKEIETLINEKKSTGTYKVEFNGKNLSSGIYFYRLQAGSFVSTKKFVLLK